MSTTRLTDLAKAVLENAKKLEQYFDTNNIPLPSFDEHAPPELPLTLEMQRIRQKAVDDGTELQDLLIGPAMLLRPVLDGTSLQAIYTFDIASKVPLDGEISFTDLARRVVLEQSDLQRILRFAMIYHRVFQEKRPGFVSHTAASRYLVESPNARAALGFMFDEVYQSFAHTVEALKSKKDLEPNNSGWAIANRTDLAMWEYHAEHPELGERAAGAMAAFTKGFNLDTTALLYGYDWSPINTEKSLLVDVGGGNGHVALALAHEYPDMRYVVAKAKLEVSQDLADRVTFFVHDFFQLQPITAQAYLFRQIFTTGVMHRAKIIANDNIGPPPGVLPPMQEKAVRSMDMIMMSLFNSRERDKEDWEALFTEADSRFQHAKVWKPEGSQLGLIEATWSG